MPDINMQVFEEAKRNQLVTKVDIQTQVALEDYQVQLSNIANPTQSQDNVVIDGHGEFLPHWNESLDFDTWVKTSMEVAGKRILMLRGNSNVSSVSNGDGVFIKYHGAATSNFKDSNTFQIPLIYEAKFRRTSSATSYLFWGFSDVSMLPVTGDAGMLMSHDTGRYLKMDNNAVESHIHEGSELTYNQWYKGKIIISSSSDSHGYFDGDEVVTGITTNIPVGNNMGLEMDAETGTCEQEYSFVRKYTATEPTWNENGAEQNIVVALKILGRAG
jgi:hypothetical protein